MGSKTDPSGPGRPRRVIPAVCSSYRLRLGLRAPMRMSRSLFISIEFLLRRLYSNGAIAALAVALDGTIRRQICLEISQRARALRSDRYDTTGRPSRSNDRPGTARSTVGQIGEASSATVVAAKRRVTPSAHPPYARSERELGERAARRVRELIAAGQTTLALERVRCSCRSGAEGKRY